MRKSFILMFEISREKTHKKKTKYPSLIILDGRCSSMPDVSSRRQMKQNHHKHSKAAGI